MSIVAFRVEIINNDPMIKATLIARTRDAFLLCESNDSMVTRYEEMRVKAKKLLGNEKTRSGEIEFVEFDNSSFVQ